MCQSEDEIEHVGEEMVIEKGINSDMKTKMIANNHSTSSHNMF